MTGSGFMWLQTLKVSREFNKNKSDLQAFATRSVGMKGAKFVLGPFQVYCIQYSFCFCEAARRSKATKCLCLL